MNKRFTQKQLDDLVARGKIRGYTVTKKKQIQTENGKIVAKAFAKRSKEKEFIELNLVYWANARGFQVVQEHRFHPERKFRFDWCLPAIMVAIEYEGGILNPNGDHRSVKGMNRDIEKYNQAQLLGWRVLRFTALNYKTLLTELNKIV